MLLSTNEAKLSAQGAAPVYQDLRVWKEVVRNDHQHDIQTCQWNISFCWLTAPGSIWDYPRSLQRCPKPDKGLLKDWKNPLVQVLQFWDTQQHLLLCTHWNKKAQAQQNKSWPH